MERQIKLSFEPVAHKYTDETGIEYTSVTTVIGKYKEPFNRKYWSMYTALKDSGFKVRPDNKFKHIVVNGRRRTLDSLYSNPINSYEVKHLIKQWEELTRVACERGNKIHDYLEDSINISKGDITGKSNDDIQPALKKQLSAQGLTVEIRTVHDLDKTNLQHTYPTIYNRILNYINMGCIIYAEKRVYSTTFGIAGMIDVLIIKGKQFCILDWKSNKDEMLFQSGYYKKQKVGNGWIKTSNFIYRPKYLFKPLNNIEDCKGMIYTLQLSLYAYIMELWGYKLVKGGLEIFHIRPNLEPKLIKVRYLKEDVQRMLIHHKESKTKKVKTKQFGIS